MNGTGNEREEQGRGASQRKTWGVARCGVLGSPGELEIGNIDTHTGRRGVEFCSRGGAVGVCTWF